MKLLKLNVISGYKMLSKNFEINFLTKTRVDKDVPNDELLTLEENFYYPIEIALLNRFTTPKEVKRIISGLEKGTIDLVFGTSNFNLEGITYSNDVISIVKDGILALKND